jgi:biotin-dependent carboxylase-like uncharacterized protein
MSVHVLAPGLLTTLQDGGRRGWRHLGVGSAGALDAFSHAVANRLVGNAGDAVAMEISLQGPRLRFDRAARIALCGADIEATVDDTALPGWRRIDLPAGSTLALGRCRRGARACLAVAGGFAVPAVLGSASTDLRGGFGGMRGRALAAGDVLPLANRSSLDIDALEIAPWWIDPTSDLDLHRDATHPAIVRVLPGRDALVPADALFAGDWRVAPASNRQGLRLVRIGAASAAARAPARGHLRTGRPGHGPAAARRRPHRAAGRRTDPRRLSAHRPCHPRRLAATGPAAARRGAAFPADHCWGNATAGLRTAAATGQNRLCHRRPHRDPLTWH